MGKICAFIKKGIKNLFKSKLTRNILVITGGAAAAQVINMFFSPVITRIYTPEEYGVLALLSSLLMIMSFPSLRYELAIPIEKKDNKAMNIVVLSTIVLFLFILILFFLFAISGDTLLAIFDASKLSRYKYFVPIGVFLIGLREVFTQWAYRRKNFKIISKTRVGQGLAGNSTKVGLGFLGYGASGLLIGEIMKQSVSVIPLAINFFKSEKDLIKKTNKNDILWSMKRYKNFPIYQTPSSFLSMFKNQLPIFGLSYYGSLVVGLYGLANTVVKIPMTLVGHSVRNVFYAEAASIGKSNPIKLKVLSNKLFIRMVMIGLLPFFALIIWGPQLFTIVFGPNWYDAGVFARFMAVSIYADFIFSPVSRVYEVLERQKEKMIIDFIGLLLVILAFTLARYFNTDANVAIMFHSISMFLFYLLTFIFARKFMNKEIEKVKFD